MKKITPLSDYHSYFDPELIPHIDDADEIWHAGDIGDVNSIQAFKDKAAPIYDQYKEIMGEDLYKAFGLE